MTKIEIALLCSATDSLDLENRPRRLTREPPPAGLLSRFYIFNRYGTQEARTEHGLIVLWAARRSRLRGGLRRLL